ncbi:MAG: LCP family protein, partial [Chloroflexota bacterium]
AWPTRRVRGGAGATPAPTPDPTPRPTAMPAIDRFATIAGEDGRFTILILGSDARRNLAGERTDAIMVATIDPGSGRVAMASLPRDTVSVPIGPGRTFASPNRINGLLQAFELDGADRPEALRKVRKAIAYAFDIEIDAYALIGFRGLERLVDRIGGVTVTLDAPLVDPTMHLAKRGLRLKAGPNDLAGNEALAFSRTRHSDSDYQRVARQQQLLAAIGRKVAEGGTDALPELAAYALTQVETDLPLAALPVLAELGARARWKTFRSVVLGPSTFAGPGPLLYTIALRLDPVRATMDRLFGPVG